MVPRAGLEPTELQGLTCDKPGTPRAQTGDSQKDKSDERRHPATPDEREKYVSDDNLCATGVARDFSDDDGLQEVITAWERLPGAIRAAIRTMVRTIS
jgi:hypothetical protein